MLVYCFIYVTAVVVAATFTHTLPSIAILLVIIFLSSSLLYWLIVKETKTGDLQQSVLTLSLNNTWINFYTANRFQTLFKWCCCFCLFWSVSLLHGHYLVSQQFDDDEYARDCRLSGWVTGLPILNYHYSRFNVKVESLSCKNIDVRLSKLKLGLYRSNVKLHAGDKLLADVKLKSPRSSYSKNSFDTQLWSITNNINASGYVKKIITIKKNNHWLYSLRDKLRHWIQSKSISTQAKSTLLALILGDKSAITDEQWKQMRYTGTVHLLIVSGLHIGIMLAIGWWLSYFIAFVCNLLNCPFSTRLFPEIGALMFSFGYLLLAGASLSTQRAWLMALILIAGKWLGNNFSLWARWWFALIVVISWQPLSVMQTGLWLSFCAVAGLICLQGYKTTAGKWVYVIKSQWLVWLSLLPLLVVFFGQVSLISPLVNLVAISFISILLVFLMFSFVAAVFGWLLPLQLAAKSIDYFWAVLDSTEEFAYQFVVNTQSLSPLETLLVITGCFCIVLPFSKKLKLIALFSWSLLIYPANMRSIASNEFKVTLIDVGQGLSALVQTNKHNVLFDTGASFSKRSSDKQGFSYFNSVIKPLLTSLNINTLDLLVISHTDNDHSGGLEHAVASMPILAIDSEISVEPTKKAIKCTSAKKWKWDNVRFHYRQPERTEKLKPNNRSCILELGNKHCKVLIMADAEKKIEKRLLPSTIQAKENVLIVGHHGSNTSTGQYLLNSESFDIALISSGYKNRYNHPHPQVLKRLDEAGLSVYRTDIQGSITISSGFNGCSIESYKETHKRYWW